MKIFDSTLILSSLTLQAVPNLFLLFIIREVVNATLQENVLFIVGLQLTLSIAAAGSVSNTLTRYSGNKYYNNSVVLLLSALVVILCLLISTIYLYSINETQNLIVISAYVSSIALYSLITTYLRISRKHKKFATIVIFIAASKTIALIVWQQQIADKSLENLFFPWTVLNCLALISIAPRKFQLIDLKSLKEILNLSISFGIVSTLIGYSFNTLVNIDKLIFKVSDKVEFDKRLIDYAIALSIMLFLGRLISGVYTPEFFRLYNTDKEYRKRVSKILHVSSNRIMAFCSLLFVANVLIWSFAPKLGVLFNAFSVGFYAILLQWGQRLYEAKGLQLRYFGSIIVLNITVVIFITTILSVIERVDAFGVILLLLATFTGYSLWLTRDLK